MSYLLVLLIYCTLTIYAGIIDDCRPHHSKCEETTRQWLKTYHAEFVIQRYNETTAEWEYETNLTKHNSEAAQKAASRLLEFKKLSAEKAKCFSLKNTTNPRTVRLLKLIGEVGINLNITDSERLSELKNNFSDIFSTAEICAYDEVKKVADCSKKWTLAKNLTSLMASSRDERLLSYIWEAWRNVSGRPIKTAYKIFVDLANSGAQNDGFDDAGAIWRHAYEDPNLKKTLDDLWRQLLPMYEQLHTYVRRQIRKQYPGHSQTSTIPAHLLGNMWAQQWNNIFNFTVPFPSKSSIDVTDAMVKQGYTSLKMFQLADELFKSLGMIAAPPQFWNNTMMVQRANSSVQCHASAWNFWLKKDVRIKMCATVNMEDLITIVHEMGHIQYFLQYADQPPIFQQGANPGFHEAVGDTIMLSATTPEYLQSVGLLHDYYPDKEQDINYLFKQALVNIAFLPFGYLIDLWRWKVFDGTYRYDEWNSKWWELREKFQGMHPPVPRTREAFDPGSKYHVPAHVPYMSYFVSFILQFQFYKTMCNASGHEGVLYKCNFHNSKAAGAKLANMLKLGRSVPWPTALQQLTGEKKLSVEPIKEYFKPLMDWLQKENQGDCFGWGYQWPKAYKLPKPRCSKTLYTPAKTEN